MSTRRATRPSASAWTVTEGVGLYDVLSGDVEAAEAIRETPVERLSLLASTPDLAGATMELPRLPGSERRLRDALAPVRDEYAYTLLDCPPSLGPLTVNALVAADRVIVRSRPSTSRSRGSPACSTRSRSSSAS